MLLGKRSDCEDSKDLQSRIGKRSNLAVELGELGAHQGGRKEWTQKQFLGPR